MSNNRIFSNSNIELLTDLSIISSFISLLISIIGLIISIKLIIEAKKLSKLFISKARVPEIIESLRGTYSDISTLMPDFCFNQNIIFTKFTEAKSLVENLENKISKDLEKKKCKEFKDLFFKDKIFLYKRKKEILTINESWELLRELSALITTLSEHEKDLKWN